MATVGIVNEVPVERELLGLKGIPFQKRNNAHHNKVVLYNQDIHMFTSITIQPIFISNDDELALCKIFIERIII